VCTTLRLSVRLSRLSRRVKHIISNYKQNSTNPQLQSRRLKACELLNKIIFRNNSRKCRRNPTFHGACNGTRLSCASLATSRNKRRSQTPSRISRSVVSLARVSPLRTFARSPYACVRDGTGVRVSA